MTSPGSKSRIKWEGDSNEEIRSWPEDIRQDFGAELQRLENREQPLNSKSMGKSMPGIREISFQDAAFWYRLLYALKYKFIYVLHCFRKQSNKTPQGDRDKATDRFAEAVRRDDPKKEEQKSA
jgi:phage-related protein